MDNSSSLTGKLRAFYARHREMITFLIAGGFNTLFGFLLFAGLFFAFSEWVHYLLLAIAAGIVSISVAFLVYRYFVFQSTGNFWQEYFRTYVVYGASTLANIVMLALLVELIGLHPVLAQLVATVVTAIISFFGHKYFTFGGNGSD